MENTNVTDGNPFPHKVKINFHMLGALVLNRIGGHADNADIVTVHQSCLA
jgi:hypothetical protein